MKKVKVSQWEKGEILYSQREKWTTERYGKPLSEDMEVALITKIPTVDEVRGSPVLALSVGHRGSSFDFLLDEDMTHITALTNILNSEEFKDGVRGAKEKFAFVRPKRQRTNKKEVS